MALNIKGAHIVAVLIAGGIIGWMWQGNIIVGGQAESENATPPPAERAETAKVLQKVRYTTVIPEEREQLLSLRGRTEAASVVQVRAETNGVVEQRLVKKGQLVDEGDTVCKLDAGVRQSAFTQAQTALSQAQSDYESNVKLQEQGFTTNSRLLALRSAKDAAKTQLEQAEKDLENTEIVAKATGIVQDPVAEVGNLLNPGDVCVTIVQTNPMKFIGQISERKVNAISVGDQALISLVSGSQVPGIIRYISPSADPQTRTFKVEIEMPNEDNLLRDGVTASANISLQAGEAFQVKSSWLTLSDSGDVGVRIINNDNVVDFVPVQILAQTPDAVWVNGLTSGQRIITLGQEYVASGQEVIAVEETAQNINMKAETQS